MGVSRTTRPELQSSARLQEGIAFVDTPGIASLATTGTELAYVDHLVYQRLKSQKGGRIEAASDSEDLGEVPF